MTYSIVALDETTKELGAAVQSHWFSVGPLVPWVRPGVGAVCTQSFVDPAYGPGLLDLLAAGDTPQAALATLLAADAQGAPLRQVAVIDAKGQTATHTGACCVVFAGHATGPGFSAQANMMASAEVWPAMARAFSGADPSAPLARRLLAALDAAEGAGGDVRGRQSAALLVAPAAGEPWRTIVDLRVEDHPEPLHELARLLDVRAAYGYAEAGDNLVAAGRFGEAGAAFEQALALAPDNHELLFWAGLSDAQAGEMERGVARVREAIARHAGWADLLPRLSAEITPSAAAVRAVLDAGP